MLCKFCKFYKPYVRYKNSDLSKCIKHDTVADYARHMLCLYGNHFELNKNMHIIHEKSKTGCKKSSN